MTNSVDDEEFARRVLIKYLTMRERPGFECKRNRNDPPDIVVTRDDGAQFGVEVVRTYQQVVGSDVNDMISSATLSEALRRFGETLGEETKNIRKRDYTLSLGPSPADSLNLRPNKFDRKWRKMTRNTVRHHIENDDSNILRCTGAWLKPGTLGNRWTVMVSAGVAEISSAISCMLERALTEKANDLPRWNGNFISRWLLILNAYPLADDYDKIRTALKQLICGNSSLAGFDSVLWSGASDRALVPILGDDLHFG